MDKIESFDEAFSFLSNFHPSPIVFEGIEYRTVEHAFQAAKTLDLVKRKTIASVGLPGIAKKLGRSLKLREDWEEVKLKVMLELVRIKFQDYELKLQLLATHDATLIEGNWWDDTFWGVCKGVGTNHLGRILMQVRDELRKEYK